MDPPPHRNLHASGIPRLSKLPLPRSAVKPPPPPEPTKYAPKSRALPGKMAQNAAKTTTFVETDNATSQSFQQSASESQAVENTVAGNLYDVQPEYPVKSHSTFTISTQTKIQLLSTRESCGSVTTAGVILEQDSPKYQPWSAATSTIWLSDSEGAIPRQAPTRANDRKSDAKDYAQ
ncbi:MAG: hypothetical protein Q9161_001213 [Pseudevernia consocians]